MGLAEDMGDAVLYLINGEMGSLIVVDGQPVSAIWRPADDIDAGSLIGSGVERWRLIAEAGAIETGIGRQLVIDGSYWVVASVRPRPLLLDITLDRYIT